MIFHIHINSITRKVLNQFINIIKDRKNMDYIVLNLQNLIVFQKYMLDIESLNLMESPHKDS